MLFSPEVDIPAAVKRTVHAPAKINLGLHVLRRRPDGYHDIETVLLHISWTDKVTAQPADRLTMTCSDSALPTDERNLCMMAAHRLAAAYDVQSGAALHLQKRVPYGAGLGGGSSDAAASLRLLRDLWDLPAGRAELSAVAAEVGSDVPFFLGETAAYATGRGEKLAPLQSDYQLPYALVVAVPDVQVSTPEAYGWVEPRAESRPDLRALVLSSDLDRWRQHLVNDFEEPVFDRYPAVRRVKELLEDEGAGYAALSGSGSAVFGVFDKDEAAEAAARHLEKSKALRAVRWFPGGGGS